MVRIKKLIVLSGYDRYDIRCAVVAKFDVVFVVNLTQSVVGRKCLSISRKNSLPLLVVTEEL